MDAGLDWTGTPSLNEPHPYGPCIIAVNEVERFDAAWKTLKREAGIACDAEIKGHKSPPEVLARVMELALKNADCIGVLLLDKRDALRRNASWPAPAKLREHVVQLLMETLLEKIALRSLLCDEEVRSKSEQQSFRTAILRRNAHRHGNRLKISFRPSEKSNLIQCADVVAYVAARSLRLNGLTPELRTLWQRVQHMQTMQYRVAIDWGKSREAE